MKKLMLVLLFLLIPVNVYGSDLIYSVDNCVVCSEKISIQYLYQIAKQGDTEAFTKVLTNQVEQKKCWILYQNLEFFLMAGEGDYVLVRPKGEAFVLWSLSMDWRKSPVPVQKEKENKPNLNQKNYKRGI